MYRHGDVILLDPKPLPANAVRRATDVVAEGELTGHAHRVVNGEVRDSDSGAFLIARQGAALMHEEHKRLAVQPTAPGMAYPVRIQREYDDEQEWRQVAD